MIKAKNHNEKIILDFFQAYTELNMNKIESFLAEDIVVYITNECAALNKIVGREEYMKRHRQMKITGVELKLNVPQIITINTG